MVVQPPKAVALARAFGLDAVYLFGSRADDVASALRRGQDVARVPSSDIDVGVLLLPGVHLDARDRARLVMALETMLGDAPVDLVILSEAPPFLAFDVVAGERLVATDPDRVAEYELYVMRRAGDLAPYERERRRMILAGEAR
jgi:predicted nucleotidyltransferase